MVVSGDFVGIPQDLSPIIQRDRLAREGQKFNTGVALNEKGEMNLQWF